MGCYGIGISRLMGAIAEIHNDQNGLIWPKEVAPYDIHLISIGDEKLATTEALKIYESLNKAGVEVLWDDREDVSAGAKFADADLIGIPVRLVVSKRNGDKIEVKRRDSERSELLNLEEVIKKISN